ncbi:hypothetical protein Q4575_09955 [Psychrosphaera sp. 1_MG-2023]|uniref:hypothetical protein n=1 Tax=Psychrosphaera sp. 1_MG-2023 TaxID=3062643 RepID=UPI0026E2C55A|nr:hypothetical protein [Psychrosphaera sp. 1_MG-2023]MDO6719726.1 hypothetical protein [Psychrosphaera sp. 1_MG-2023]
MRLISLVLTAIILNLMFNCYVNADTNVFVIDDTPKCQPLGIAEQNICVEVTAVNQECEDSILGEFLESCTVDIEYIVTSNYEGDSYIKTFVDCAVITEVKSEVLGNTQIYEDSSETNISLFEDQSAERTTDFLFMYSHRAQANEVQITKAGCRISEANIW